MRSRRQAKGSQITSATLAYLLKRRFWLAADIGVVTVIGGGLWWQWLNLVPDVNIPVPPPLPSPNAFDTFTKAGKSITGEEVIEGASSKTSYLPTERNGVPYSNAEKAAAVAANADALATVRVGITQKFQTPARRTLDAPFLEMAEFRRIARLLNLEGQVREAKGDLGGAAQSRLDAIYLGAENPRGGVLIHSLVGVAIEKIGMTPLWALANKLSASEARFAAKRLEEIDARRVPLSDVLLEEKWWGVAGMLQEFRSKTTLKVQRDMIGSLSGEDGGSNDWGQNLSQTAQVLIPLLKTSKAQIIANHNAYMDSIIARSRLPYAVASRTPQPAIPSDPIAAMIFPVFEGVRIRDTDMRMQSSLLATVFALRAYQAEHGAFPSDLNALVAGGYLSRVPADPFSATGDTPFQYRLLDDGKYLLYSIGPDGKDDTGTPMPTESALGRSKTSVEADTKGDFVVGVNTIQIAKSPGS